MTQEFERFLHLFDQIVLFSEGWLDRMRVEQLDWAPIEGPSIKFGDRVSRITVKGLVIHLIVGEAHWVEQLKTCAPGATIATPKNPGLEREIAEGDFRAAALALHRAHMAALRAYSDDDLRKEIVFSERRWSVMGFLWAMYSHRAFHLGNIDIYLRQSGIVAPDYFRFPSFEMA
jgi:uncharacterized damage-inducible protein DinB